MIHVYIRGEKRGEAANLHDAPDVIFRVLTAGVGLPSMAGRKSCGFAVLRPDSLPDHAAVLYGIPAGALFYRGYVWIGDSVEAVGQGALLDYAIEVYDLTGVSSECSTSG